MTAKANVDRLLKMNEEQEKDHVQRGLGALPSTSKMEVNKFDFVFADVSV